MKPHHTHDPLQPHQHEPNPAPPTDDSTITVTLPDRTQHSVTVANLAQLPLTAIPNCYIVSTGHGTSGPFTFGGVQLRHFIEAYLSPKANWSQVEVISADGFGNRVLAQELTEPDSDRPMLLSYLLNGEPLTREAGLVRLIVPSEKDDALRQVKWVAQINILA